MTVINEDDKGGIVGQGDKKNIQFSLPRAESDEIDKVMEALKIPDRAQFYREATEALRKERLEAERKEMGIDAPPRYVNAPDPMNPMDQMMAAMWKDLEFRRLNNMINSYQGGQGQQGQPQRSRADQLYDEEAAMRQRMMDREDRREQREQLMNVLTIKMLADKDSGGSSEVAMLMQQMEKDRQASDQRWAEFRAQQEADRQAKLQADREAETTRLLEGLMAQNDELRNKLDIQSESYQHQLANVQQDMNVRMEESLRDMQGARQHQDEFTQTLESYRKVNELVETIAPNIGYRKSGALGLEKAMAQGMGQPAASPPKAAVSDYMNLGLALLGEVKEIMQSGAMLSQQVQSQMAPQAIPGAPPVPQGPPGQVMPGMAQPPPIQVPIGRPEPQVIKGTPGDQSPIDPGLVGLKTGKQVPVKDSALIKMTQMMRSGQQGAPMKICDDHGDLEPCPDCARVQTQVKSCDMCSKPMPTGECPECMQKLLAFVPKYDPLIKQLYDAGKDITGIVQEVEKANILSTQHGRYRDASICLEKAAKMTVAGLQELQGQPQQPQQAAPQMQGPPPMKFDPAAPKLEGLEPPRVENEPAWVQSPDSIDDEYAENIRRANSGEEVGVPAMKYDQVEQAYEPAGATPPPMPAAEDYISMDPDGGMTVDLTKVPEVYRQEVMERMNQALVEVPIRFNTGQAIVPQGGQFERQPQPQNMEANQPSTQQQPPQAQAYLVKKQQVDDKLQFWGEEIAKIRDLGLVDVTEEITMYNQAITNMDADLFDEALKLGEMSAIYANAKHKSALELQQSSAEQPQPVAQPQPQLPPESSPLPVYPPVIQATQEIAQNIGISQGVDKLQEQLQQPQIPAINQCSCGAPIPDEYEVCANCIAKTQEEPPVVVSQDPVGSQVETLQEAVDQAALREIDAALIKEPEMSTQQMVQQFNAQPVTFLLFDGVQVPGGNGPIVGFKSGGHGRILAEQDGVITVQTLQGQIQVTPEDLLPGVCTYCGRDCKKAGAKTVHEKSCKRKYDEYMKS